VRHLADAVSFAAWVTVAVALVAMALHLVVRPVSPAAFALAISISSVAAILQAAFTRIRASECAAWADRFLGGSSAYATYLECSATLDRRQDNPALHRLVEWIEQAAPRSLEQLRSIPPQAGVLKPVAVALVAVTLAAVLLQVPVRPHAAVTSASSVESGATAQLGPDTPELASTARVDEDAPAADGARPRKARNEETGREGQVLTPVLEDERTTPEEVKAAGEAQGAADAKRAASGGRDAGDSPDTAADTGLSEAWQGAMASTLRSLSEPPVQATRTDSTRAADFSADTIANGSARAVDAITPAPAAAPEARRAVRLGPAEQAYVRAYFAGSGATQ
jgi:hypothetical protein